MGHTRANDLLYLNLLTIKNLPELFSLNPKYSYQTLICAWICERCLAADNTDSKLYWNWLTCILMGRTLLRKLMDQHIMEVMASPLNVSYIL